MKNFFCKLVLLTAVLTITQLTAMNKGQSGKTTSELQKLFEERKKLHEEKWKIEEELNKVAWELWRLDLQINRWYYGLCTVGIITATGIAALAYRTYYMGDDAEESQENIDEDCSVTVQGAV